MAFGISGYIQYTGTDTLGLGGGNINNRPNLVAPVTYPKHRLAWFSTSSFANPTAPWNGGPNQGFGNAGKDAVVGPGFVNFNWSLYKTIAFKEGGPSLELRFEFFNVFNHTQFGGTSNDDSIGTQRTRTSDRSPLPTILAPCSLVRSSTSDLNPRHDARAPGLCRPGAFLFSDIFVADPSSPGTPT